MKTITIVLLQVVFILSSSLYGFAQLTVVNEPQTPSVQASEMTKYGKQDVNLYTGELSLNIPLYTYRDDDFTIPISLSYSYNGLKVNHQAGFAGLGWTLVFGGYITREVRGIPDESNSSIDIFVNDQKAQIDLWGYNYNNTYSSDNVYAQVLGESTTPKDLFNTCYFDSQVTKKRYEFTSDIYHFNFLGHSGSFVKDSLTGNYNVFHTSTFDGNYTVTLYAEPLSSLPNPYISGFSIRTSDGYVYHFGSYDPYSSDLEGPGYGALEREVSRDKSNSDQIIPGTITSWALRSITAPNGRYVRFLYGNDHSVFDEASSIVSFSPSIWYYSENPAQQTIFCSESYTSYLLPSYLEVDGNNNLVSISYSGKDSGNLPHYINGNNGAVSVNQDQTYPLLAEINGPGCHATLKYAFNKNGSPTPFLSSVEIDSLGSYSFQYKGLEDGYFPPLGTSAKDHWGYANKTSEVDCTNNSVSLSQLVSSSGLSETLTSFRNPDFAASSLGLMTSISYPTGGSSIIEWEPNTYTSKVAKTASNNFVPSLVQQSGTGPGGRIRKIVNRNPDGTAVDSISYHYTKHQQGGLVTGSGTLLVSPRYSIRYSSAIYGTQNNIYNMCFYSDGGIVAYDGIPVEYSEVEQFFSDGSTTRTRFTSWENGYPDLFNSQPVIPVPRMYYGYSIPYFFVPDSRQAVTNILLPLTSLQWRRGKVLSQDVYDAFSNKLRRESNTYTPASDRREAIEFVYVGEGAVLTHKRAEGFYKTFSRIEDFRGGLSGAFSSGSSYNSLGQKIADTTTTLSGEKTITEYLYASDKYASGAILSPAEDSMRVAGWHSFPLEVRTISIKDQVETLISHDRYTYRKVSGSDSLNFKPVLWEKKDLASGQWYTFATYGYDKYGRMIQKTDANGISTVFVWSSEHLGPSLRIDNATVSEVSSIISGCFYSTGNTNAQARASTLKSQLPRSAVSWFSWYEYGMPKEAGDPSGRVTHYTYDSAKRLHLVVDDSLNPVEKYDYQTSTRKE